MPMQVGLRTSLHEPEPFSAGSSSHALSSRSPRLSTRPSVPKLPRELKIPPRSPRAGLRAGKMATPRTRSLAQPGPRSAVRRRQREAAGDPLFSPTLPRAAATVPIRAAGSSPRLMRIQSDDMALSADVYGAIGSGVSGCERLASTCTDALQLSVSWSNCTGRCVCPTFGKSVCGYGTSRCSSTIVVEARVSRIYEAVLALCRSGAHAYCCITEWRSHLHITAAPVEPTNLTFTMHTVCVGRR